MRAFFSFSSLRRAIPVAVALALLAPAQAATAARDPLAEAEARVTSAQRAANEAAEQYEEAQSVYWGLEGDIDRTRSAVSATEANAAALTAVAQRRAVEAYTEGGLDLDVVVEGNDVLEAQRRNELLDRVNEDGNLAVEQLGAITEDLRVQEASLADQIAQQEQVVRGVAVGIGCAVERVTGARIGRRDLSAGDNCPRSIGHRTCNGSGDGLS